MVLQITIEPRENCISCSNCHSNCPDVFELNIDDGYSSIKEEYRVKDASLGEGEIPESLEDCVRLAEELCPVTIIHLID